MTIILQNQFYTIVGLSLGLIAMLFGMHMSSAIESTPALVGIVSAVWCAVSVSIFNSTFSKPAK